MSAAVTIYPPSMLGSEPMGRYTENIAVESKNNGDASAYNNEPKGSNAKARSSKPKAEARAVKLRQ